MTRHTRGFLWNINGQPPDSRTISAVNESICAAFQAPPCPSPSSCFSRPCRASGPSLLYDGSHRGFDVASLLVLPQPVSHHCRGKNGGHGIGDALSCNVGRGAMDGFEKRPLPADFGRGRKAQPADEPCAEVRQDVAEKIRGQDDVQIERIPHQLEAAVVDVHLLQLYLRMLPP